MSLVALYSFHLGHGNDEEIIRKDDVFYPVATAAMSRQEHEQSLINQQAARRATPDELKRFRETRA
jgi:hypothetical protein